MCAESRSGVHGSITTGTNIRRGELTDTASWLYRCSALRAKLLASNIIDTRCTGCHGFCSPYIINANGNLMKLACSVAQFGNFVEMWIVYVCIMRSDECTGEESLIGSPRRGLASMHSIAEVVQTHSLRAAVLLMPRSFMSATTSSWRTLSREMPNSLPTSNKVRLRPSPIP